MSKTCWDCGTIPCSCPKEKPPEDGLETGALETNEQAMDIARQMKDKFREASESLEWEGWKIVSDMLDKPNEIGIYPTGECYQKLYDFVVGQKEKAVQEERAILRKKVEEVKLLEPENGEEMADTAVCYNHAIDKVLDILE